MAIYTDTKYRIKRNAEQQEQMQYLIQDLKIFQSYSQILMLSAIVGYNSNLYVPITTPASDGVLMQFFTETDYDLMDLLAYAHAKEQAILKEDKKYEIFEAYANAGFPILLKLLEIEPDTEIDAAKQEAILVRLASLLISKQVIIQNN